MKRTAFPIGIAVICVGLAIVGCAGLTDKSYCSVCAMNNSHDVNVVKPEICLGTHDMQKFDVYTDIFASETHGSNKITIANNDIPATLAIFHNFVELSKTASENKPNRIGAVGSLVYELDVQRLERKLCCFDHGKKVAEFKTSEICLVIPLFDKRGRIATELEKPRQPFGSVRSTIWLSVVPVNQ